MFWRKKDKSAPASTNPFDQDSISTGSSNPPPTPPSYENQGRYGTRKDEGDERNELFGSAPQKYNAPSRQDGYGNYGAREEEDEDQEVSGLKQQIRNVKNDTLASTRNALQKIHETEQTAGNTMTMLGQQSTQLANVDRNLDLSKAYSDRAASQASELKQLNRSIFIPVIKNPFTKGSRERKELESRRQDHAEHMQERDNIRQFEYESQARVEAAQRQNERVAANSGYRRGRSEADRRKYQFEEDEEDDAIEDEIDQNLDLLGGATARLRNMALTMNSELDSQNKQLDKVSKKVDPLSEKLVMTTHKLDSTR
ncbi:Protein transport protein S9 plasma membrane t-SNARE [Apophysomyces sp. BC1034]|nr:Protein transport protein S9 plasma membrane t-SNARE [Apophysomyces sp. BC1015]KAG0177791.1 Protein transport protein S9 plasma membrane t-SNARE [Apophysomyces sp. BC1021]KAG0188064.1 Protein transport protein S9 plasma membrane t-SNARE [Apophysomyces sp. BC1034]